MDVVDIDEAAEQLYALTPAEFTAGRTKLSAEARKEKAPDLAKAIAELRKPTVSAWLINQLARDGDPDQPSGRLMDQLQSLGAQLRAAQAQLDGAQMRELTQKRHELVAALVRRANEVALGGGQKISGSVQRELEETFGAAVADEQASLAVTSGRLTRALVYAGLGEVDVSAATATPISRAPKPRPAAGREGSRPRRRETEESQEPAPQERPGKADRAAAEAAEAAARAVAEAAARDAAEAAVQTARTALEATEGELTASARQLEASRAHEDELSTRLDELQREINATRHELDRAGRTTAAADRDHQRRERQLREARKALQRAEQALPDP